jgi:hypothetical protein
MGGLGLLVRGDEGKAARPKPEKPHSQQGQAPLSGILQMPCRLTGKPLTEQAKGSNRTKSTVRVRVEHTFGAQANNMDDTLVRTIRLLRAKAKIGMKTSPTTYATSASCAASTLIRLKNWQTGDADYAAHNKRRPQNVQRIIRPDAITWQRTVSDALLEELTAPWSRK